MKVNRQNTPIKTRQKILEETAAGSIKIPYCRDVDNVSMIDIRHLVILREKRGDSGANSILLRCESKDAHMIHIQGNVPSSKNSKQWTGRFLIPSKTTTRYVRATKMEYMINQTKFKQMFTKYPYSVGLYFIRNSKRHFDYINACQIVADLMVKYGWIEDDDADHFVPVFLGYHVDKKNAGVEITRYIG